MSDSDSSDLDHQNIAIDLIDAFAEHDAAGLAQLSPQERTDQLRSRSALYHYIDRLWENAKLRGVNPATDPDWTVVAGLRDLSNALVEQASQAQRVDDTDA